MWRLWFKRFGAKVVMTIDFDNEIRFRFAKFIDGGIIVRGVGFEKYFIPNTVPGRGYIKAWKLL